jgi:hypothetical protein
VGFYSVPPDEIKRKIGYNPSFVQSLLAIPYPGCNGFERYKTFPAIPGHPKYLQKKGTGNRLYVPSQTSARIKEPDFDMALFLTEGEKKTLAGTQAGLPVIGLSGLWNWSNGERGLIKDFDQFYFQNLTVKIVPDSDWLQPNKLGYPKNLKQAVYELAKKLIDKGAQVFVIDLPSRSDGEKVGLDDFLLSHSVEEFRNLPSREIKKDMEQPSQSGRTILWPPPLKDEAYYGLVGTFVKMIEPHTEADPVAILTQFLTGFGNVIGRGAYWNVEGDRHQMNINIALVGETAKGRKGTSFGQVKRIFKNIDPSWVANFQGGLSSGEGLIWAVRDEILKKVPIKDKGHILGYQDEIIDQGVADKRSMIIEEELASVLRVLEREGNTLSAIVRKAWDDGNLKTMTKSSPAKATNAHISIIGHITKDELKRYLTSTEACNGFGNRFIWLCVRRSKVLPEGGRVQEINFEPLIIRLKQAVEFGMEAGEIRKDEEAAQIWAGVYPHLSEGNPGLLGAVTSRAEAQVMRLACIYAVLDQSRLIRKEHLLASLALWDYAESSARYIFGEATGDPMADQIFEALKGSPDGMTRTEISGLFGRHKNTNRVDQALVTLAGRGFIKKKREQTEGRTAERWMVSK